MTLLRVLLAVAAVLSAAACVRAWRNFRGVPVLADMPDDEPAGGWPRVSVVMAARDEASRVGDAIRSRLDDDYPDLELILVDDRSTDGTGDVALAVAGGDPRLRVVRVDELPDGWLGKTHALDTGVRMAAGDFVLISDADVHLRSGALRRAVGLAQRDAVDLVVLVPEYVTSSFLTEVVWTVFLRTFSMAVDPDAVRDPARSAAMGSGAFNLVRRSALDATPGFEHLRMETGDDMAFGAMVKECGGRLAPVNGWRSACVRMYDGIGEFLRGIEKNGASTAAHPVRATVAVCAIAVLDAAPWLAVAVGPGWLRVLGAVCAAVTLGVHVAIVLGTGGRVGAALVHPLGSVLFAYGIARATWLAVRQGGVWWRGTFYTLFELEAGRRFTL